MDGSSRFATSLLLAAALASSLTGIAFAEHHRVYDPYYSDYHVWNHDESITTVKGNRDAPGPRSRFQQAAPGRTKGVLDLAA